MQFLEEVAYRTLPRVEPGRALSNWEWRVLVAAAEALRLGSPVPIEPERIADNVETFLIEGRSQRAWRVRVLLALIEGAAWTTTGRPFSELPLERRQQLIAERFEQGDSVWWLCAKVRYLVLLGIYGDAAAVEPTGYVPLWERQRFSYLRPLRRSRPQPSPTASVATTTEPNVEPARAS